MAPPVRRSGRKRALVNGENTEKKSIKLASATLVNGTNAEKTTTDRPPTQKKAAGSQRETTDSKCHDEVRTGIHKVIVKH